MQRDEPGYEPYRASGDFDRDGINDVAVVLVRGDSGVIVWLRGVSSGYASPLPDRKSTRLNSSHSQISYAVFCLKKKKARATCDSKRSIRRCESRCILTYS